LPSYIGAMIAAALIRNLNDAVKFIRISQQAVNDCAVIALYLFIVNGCSHFTIVGTRSSCCATDRDAVRSSYSVLVDVRHNLFLFHGA